MRWTPLFAIAGSCVGDATEPTGQTAADTGPVESPAPVTYGLDVELIELRIPPAASVPAPAGLCASLVDPTPFIGMPEEPIPRTTERGRVSFPDQTLRPSLGWIVQVDDCDGAAQEQVALPSNRLVFAEDFAELGDGESALVRAYTVPPDTRDALAASATQADYPRDLSEGQFLVVFVRDASGAPLANVSVTTDETVGPPEETAFFYVDDDPDGGLFAQAGKDAEPVRNTATGPSGMIVVADAPVGDYVATDSTGAVVFDPVPIGGFPGMAVFAEIVGAPAD